MYKVNLGELSNGIGEAAYGGRLDGYMFSDDTCISCFEQLVVRIVFSMDERKYFPIYRMADGEYRFLFGTIVSLKPRTWRNLYSKVKYDLLGCDWKTSWGETYDKNKIKDLRNNLFFYIRHIANRGKLALYWNENGINAFTEYNKILISNLAARGINVTNANYIPFHFAQATLALRVRQLVKDRVVLIVSGMEKEEYFSLRENLLVFGADRVIFLQCSPISSLEDDFTSVSLDSKPDLVLVAAGIGSAKIIYDMRYLNCPIIDIGSYIHVLSKKKGSAHAGFFVYPS
jgi:hypothetical protein